MPHLDRSADVVPTWNKCCTLCGPWSYVLVLSRCPVTQLPWIISGQFQAFAANMWSNHYLVVKLFFFPSWIWVSQITTSSTSWLFCCQGDSEAPDLDPLLVIYSILCWQLKWRTPSCTATHLCPSSENEISLEEGFKALLGASQQEPIRQDGRQHSGHAWESFCAFHSHLRGK